MAMGADQFMVLQGFFMQNHRPHTFPGALLYKWLHTVALYRHASPGKYDEKIYILHIIFDKTTYAPLPIFIIRVNFDTIITVRI